MAKNKMSSDYPMFGFRTFDSKHKDKLDKLVNRLFNLMKKHSNKPIKKNHVIDEALQYGLEKKIEEYEKKS